MTGPADGAIDEYLPRLGIEQAKDLVQKDGVMTRLRDPHERKTPYPRELRLQCGAALGMIGFGRCLPGEVLMCRAMEWDYGLGAS